MRLDNATSDQDAILSKCEDFGGDAYECARIAEMLDAQLTKRITECEELAQTIEELEQELKEARS